MSTEKERFRVLGSKILVEPTDLGNKVAGTDLVIPEQIAKKERIITGVVIGVGSSVEEVKVGDTILYERFIAQEIQLDKRDYHIVGNELQLHGIFSK